MVKFLEAGGRRSYRVFVCKKCKTKRKASPLKINLGRVSCRRCGGKRFRSLRKR